MSFSTLDVVMARINGAAKNSPIAVFMCPEPKKLNAVFANTVKTAGMIRDQHPDFVGVFDCDADMEKVERRLAGYVLPV